MAKNYVIELDDQDQEETFEKEDNNLLEVNIQSPGKNTIEGKGYRVYLKLSPDGMLGLGTELIRKALIAKNEGIDRCGNFVHLFPIMQDSVASGMGVYLASSSAELLISVTDEFSTVEEIVTNLKNN